MERLVSAVLGGHAGPTDRVVARCFLSARGVVPGEDLLAVAGENLGRLAGMFQKAVGSSWGVTRGVPGGWPGKGIGVAPRLESAADP
jgi:hypothetical protein